MKTLKNPDREPLTLVLNLDILMDGSRQQKSVKIDLSPQAGQSQETSPLLVDWIEYRKKEAATAADASGHGRGSALGLGTLKNHLLVFMQAENLPPVHLNAVDRDFCLKFVAYLNAARNLRIRKDRTPRPLSANTRNRLFSQLNAVLHRAVEEGYLPDNPIEKMGKGARPHPIATDRPYLTEEELKKLAACRQGPIEVRRAFLFSCLTGLRWSDICSLTEEHLRKEGDNWFIIKRMVKTGEWVSNPLGEEARKLLTVGKHPLPGQPLFTLPSASSANRSLKRWGAAAGIRKNISFHTARHTFATLLLTKGADIYTTSKLLGHNDIATTQVYARVVDEKKQKALSLINGLIGGGKE